MERKKIEPQEFTIKVGVFSQKTLGIRDEDEKWWNMEPGIGELAKAGLMEKVKNLNRGDVVKFKSFEAGTYVDFEVTEKAKGKDKDIVGFDDVLLTAHKKWKDNLSIETEIILKPDGTSPVTDGWLMKAKLTIYMADAKPRVFTGYGEATPTNADNVKDSLPRMAETRAIARALRFALGERVIAEELPQKEGSSKPQAFEKASQRADAKAFMPERPSDDDDGYDPGDEAEE
jgi:hypothetical protein